MKMQKKIISVLFLLFSGEIGLNAQSMDCISFSSVASSNNNFQPVVGMPFSGYLSNANGSLTVSSEYGKQTIEAGIDTMKMIEHSPIILYPNPTSSVINILFPYDLSIQCNATLFNLTGNTIANQCISQKVSSIDMSNFPSGIYILRFEGNNLPGASASYRIVKIN